MGEFIGGKAEYEISLNVTQVTDTNLDEAQRQKGDVVSAEEGVEEHLLDPAIEVTLQLLHLGPNQLGGV